MSNGADIAAGYDGEIEIIGEIINRLQAALLDQRALGGNGIHQQRRQEHIAFGAQLACSLHV